MSARAADELPDVLDTGAAGGKAIRGGAVRVTGYGATLLLSLASVPIMIRHLGVVDYGHFVTVSAIVFMIGGVTEAGLSNIGIREYVVRDGVDREVFLRNLIGLRMTLTVVAVLVAGALTAITGAPSVVVVGTLVTGLGLLIVMVQQTYTIPLSAQLRYGWVTILELLKHSTLTAAILVLVIANAHLPAFFWATVVSGAIAVIGTLLLLRGETALRPAFELPAWFGVLRETLPYGVAAAVGLIYFRIAVVLMSYVSSDTETGYFSAAFRIVEVLAVIPWILVLTGFPILARAARDDEQRLAYALQRTFEVATIVGAGLALALGVSAPFVIEVVAGPDFGPSTEILRLLSVAMVTSFLVATWLFGLLSLRAYRQLLVTNALAGLLAIVGTLALAPSLGAEGAALATIAAEAVLAVACALALARVRPALRPRLGVVPRVALAAAVALGPALLLSAHPLVLAAAAVVIYAGLLMALRAIPVELISALRRREPPPASF